MPGKRRNYQPIWQRVRDLDRIGRLTLPIKLWWQRTDLYAELVGVDEELVPRVRLPPDIQRRFTALNWAPFKRRVKNWPEMESRVETVRAKLDGTHTPNTLATAVFGPLTAPERTSQNYNFAQEFTLDAETLRRLYADLCATGAAVSAENTASVLLFRKSLIDPLKPNDSFRVITPFGRFVMTRAQFETVFSSVSESQSYKNGQYTYPKPPEKLFQFQEMNLSTFPDGVRRPIVEVLDLATGNSAIDEDVEEEFDIDEDADDLDPRYEARNVLLFGPPGTGKSYRLQDTYLVGIGIRDGNDRVYRTTFHPELGYHDFVGTYKPLLGLEKATRSSFRVDGSPFLLADGQPARPMSYYGYEPGPFVDALVAALNNPSKNFAIIIEEINRGNTAACFGDMFQLLDRDSQHKSQYAIRPAPALAAYLRTQTKSDVTDLRLPANLFMYATMNTSDQSLYPMDSAFKRRWTMEYVGIAFDDPAIRRIRVPVTDERWRSWWAVASVVNQRIVAVTGVDDKQMGPYFVREEGGAQVSAPSFRSKVLFYLWNDVFRGNAHALFDPAVETYDVLVQRHRERKAVFNEEVLAAVERLEVEST